MGTAGPEKSNRTQREPLRQSLIASAGEFINKSIDYGIYHAALSADVFMAIGGVISYYSASPILNRLNYKTNAPDAQEHPWLTSIDDWTMSHVNAIRSERKAGAPPFPISKPSINLEKYVTSQNIARVAVIAVAGTVLASGVYGAYLGIEYAIKNINEFTSQPYWFGNTLLTVAPYVIPGYIAARLTNRASVRDVGLKEYLLDIGKYSFATWSVYNFFLGTGYERFLKAADPLGHLSVPEISEMILRTTILMVTFGFEFAKELKAGELRFIKTDRENATRNTATILAIEVFGDAAVAAINPLYLLGLYGGTLWKFRKSL